MQFYSRLTTLRQDHPRLVIALGMFDGVHRGHRSIIKRAVDLAHEIGGESMVFTFSNHPLAVLAPQAVPPQISNNALRRQLIEELGVDILMAIPFTKDLARRTPEDFLALLRDSFAPRILVTGPNYTFGSRGKGTHRMPGTLQNRWAAYAVIGNKQFSIITNNCFVFLLTGHLAITL